MNPTAIPHLAGLLDELLLNATATAQPFGLLADFHREEAADVKNDFLVQNRRPDLVCLRSPDQALWALDLP